MSARQILTNVSWRVDQDPSTAGTYDKKDSDELTPLSDAFLDFPIIKLDSKSVGSGVDIDVSITRYQELEQKVHVNDTKGNITIRDILTAIYQFYQSPISFDDLKAMSEIDDDFDYIKDAVTDYNKGKRPNYASVIGEAHFFEGFVVGTDNSLSLILGS